MSDYKKYLKTQSEGTTSWVQEAYGHLKDLLSPEEQNLALVTNVTLADGGEVEVPTSWKAIIVTDDGETVAWRWPSYGADAELGINIIDKGYTLADVFDTKKVWHFYRDDSRRAHVTLSEEE